MPSKTAIRRKHPALRTSEEIFSHSVASDINICISECTFKDLKEKSSFKTKIQKLLNKQKPMTYDEFLNATDRLYKCCLTGVKDLHELHERRTLGVKIIIDIIERADPIFINVPYIIHIIWSIMCCIHHFQMRLRMITMDIIIWARKRESEKVLHTYERLIHKINPYMQRVALNSIITMYREGKLWEMEFACTDLIVKLLTIFSCSEEGLKDIIYTIEMTSISDITEAKYLTQVMYSVLQEIKWEKISMSLLRKIVYMTEASISPKPTDLYLYAPLRSGLENCLRNITINLTPKDLIVLILFIIKRLNSVNEKEEELIKTLGNAVIFAAKVYKIKARKKSLVKGPLPLVFGLFQTQNPTNDLLGLRIWQNLIDRSGNFNSFVTPRIFFQDCKYTINFKKYLKTDKIFFKRFRHFILNITFDCFQRAVNRRYLENVYTFMALTLVEIPCGYTASCFVTVAMGMQEYAFRITKSDLIRANHFHATVMAIMSLVCHIHKANIFYDYVNTIMERRSEMAPHLNPPLKAEYHYAPHHILWNKPELFFEDWETRYGLWHCFRKKPLKKGKIIFDKLPLSLN